MSGYVLYHVQYEPNTNKDKAVIESVEIDLVDTSLSNVKDELLKYSSKWMKDEVGKNNYQETIDETCNLNELPDGLVRRYAFTEVDAKNPYSNLNKQLSGNVIKQINVFRKNTSNGTIFGKWVDIELLRSYVVSKAEKANLTYQRTTNVVSNVKENTQQTPTYDQVIDQLKKFNFNTLRSVAERIEEERYNELQKNLEEYAPELPEEPATPELPDIPKHLLDDADESSEEESETETETYSYEYSDSSSYDVNTEEERSCDSSSGWDDDTEDDFELLQKIPRAPPLPNWGKPLVNYPNDNEYDFKKYENMVPPPPPPHFEYDDYYNKNKID